MQCYCKNKQRIVLEENLIQTKKVFVFKFEFILTDTSWILAMQF